MTGQLIWQRVRGAMEVAANVALLGVMAVAVGNYAAGRTAAADPSRDAPAPYRSGDVIEEAVDGVDLTAAPSTLFVVVQSRCRYCTESMPFYADLASAPHAGVRIVVLTQEADAIGRAYVASHGFHPDDLVSIPVVKRIAGTPTVILTDASKTVRRIWTGKLSERGEQEVKEAVGVAVSGRSQ
jgi:hypothetical protein